MAIGDVEESMPVVADSRVSLGRAGPAREMRRPMLDRTFLDLACLAICAEHVSASPQIEQRTRHDPQRQDNEHRTTAEDPWY